jgi:hypothetical protein
VSQISPDAAAWGAMQDAMARKVEPQQAAAIVAETVLRTAWNNARAMLHAPDIDHAGCIDGGCNVCILEGFAGFLGRPSWADERAGVSLRRIAPGLRTPRSGLVFTRWIRS